MYPQISGRPHSVRHSQPSGTSSERELALRLDGIVIGQKGADLDAANYRLPELPGRDGRDFRHPIFDRES
jgi:hypothetical protein